jgi:two-component system CheB/CheR fusion protein
MQPAISQLVVIGASAGGVEALSTLVSTLAPDFPAPIIVAQHLDPSRLSHLPEILGRRSKLPVRSVADQDQLLPGIIYVVPADHQVEITDHTVSVRTEGGRTRPTPSIDRLLESAAQAFGEQLVAVILTGLGSDGADGARRVKELGGTVVIQNPQTASHPEMPLSLAPTTVDIVAELEAIGPLLRDLLTGTYAPFRPDDDRRLRVLLEQVRARSGIDFSTYKEPTIRRRLQRRMLDTNNNTLEDYTRYLRRHAEEYDRLANSFLIKVTDFFRDADLFNHLREQMLPALIREARGSGSELRLWSAGCATGEEAYSLAILVSELLGEELNNFTVRIFATDLDAEAVAFARRGVYPGSALKNMSAQLQDRYFTRSDSGWEVRKAVRGMVIFGQHDLGQRAPFPRIDLVLCRNVLIYFTPELQRRSLQLFAFALRDSGYLVLGKSESTSPLPEHFSLVHPRLKIFRRQGDRVLIPPSVSRPASPLSRPVLAGMQRELARVHARQAGAQTTAERSEQVLLDLPIGVVLVDRNYDIQSINAAARRLLGIHTPAIDGDLVHLAYRALAAPLRDTIDAAVNGDEPRAVHEITSLPDTPGETRYFELAAVMQRPPAERTEQSEGLVVLIADVTARERELRERKASLAAAQAHATRVQELLDESTRSVRQLLAANQELATTNASLRSTNEEMLVGNEEAQAAMEEIETLNEEQQATNEELETLNEELQATVEELNATNDDLQSRTVELLEQAEEREGLLTALGQERHRLAAILASMADAVLVVDTHAEPVLTNAAFVQTFGQTLPPLEGASGQPLPARASPQRLVARGETFTYPFTIAGQDGARRWFEATGQPILGDAGIEGGVVVIRDVTDRSLRQLQEQFVALTGHEFRTPLTALRGSLELLQRVVPNGDGQDPRLNRYLSIGLEQARLLSDLVQDLADVVRMQTGQLTIVPADVDLAEVVQAAVELARTIPDAQEIKVDVATGPLVISGDRRRLQQVVLNLLANAIQHGSSAEGATVRLRGENEHAVLEVIDHGPGIPPEERQRVFERFYSADRPGGSGLGLGLYLVQAIVTAHGGTVQVESPNEHGTTFVVRFPRLDGAVSVQSEQSS